MTLGPRVRERRKAIRLSQEQLASRAGLTWSAIQRLEAGQVRDPHYSTLSSIAHVLGTTVAEMVGEEPAAPKPSAPPKTGPEALESDIGGVSDIDELARIAKALKAEWTRLAAYDRVVKLSEEEYLENMRRLEEIEEDIMTARERAHALRKKLGEYEAEGVFELAGAAG